MSNYYRNRHQRLQKLEKDSFKNKVVFLRNNNGKLFKIGIEEFNQMKNGENVYKLVNSKNKYLKITNSYLEGFDAPLSEILERYPITLKGMKFYDVKYSYNDHTYDFFDIRLIKTTDYDENGNDLGTESDCILVTTYFYLKLSEIEDDLWRNFLTSIVSSLSFFSENPILPNKSESSANVSVSVNPCMVYVGVFSKEAADRILQNKNGVIQETLDTNDKYIVFIKDEYIRDESILNSFKQLLSEHNLSETYEHAGDEEYIQELIKENKDSFMVNPENFKLFGNEKPRSYNIDNIIDKTLQKSDEFPSEPIYNDFSDVTDIVYYKKSLEYLEDYNLVQFTVTTEDELYKYIAEIDDGNLHFSTISDSSTENVTLYENLPYYEYGNEHYNIFINSGKYENSQTPVFVNSQTPYIESFLYKDSNNNYIVQYSIKDCPTSIEAYTSMTESYNNWNGTSFEVDPLIDLGLIIEDGIRIHIVHETTKNCLSPGFVCKDTKFSDFLNKLDSFEEANQG